MKHQLILAKAPKAAAMMSMTQNKFLELVKAGSLPRPVNIIGTNEPRWRVSELENIWNGDAMEDDGGW